MLRRWFELLDQDAGTFGTGGSSEGGNESGNEGDAGNEGGSEGSENGAGEGSAGADGAGAGTASADSDSDSGSTSSDPGEPSAPDIPNWLKQASKEFQGREDLWDKAKIDDIIKERDQFAEKVKERGEVPESPDKYNIDSSQLNDQEKAVLEEVKKEAHEAGFTNEQFEKFAHMLNRHKVGVGEEIRKLINGDMDAKSANHLFQQEWGKEFDQNYGNMKKGIDIMGPKFSDFLRQTGAGNNPDVIRALTKVGSYFAEDDTPLTESQGGIMDDDTQMLKNMYPSMFS